MHHIDIQLIDQIVILKIDLTWNRRWTIYSLEKAGNQLVVPVNLPESIGYCLSGMLGTSEKEIPSRLAFIFVETSYLWQCEYI